MTAPESFREQLAGRRVVPVVRELFADGETPLGVFRKLGLDREGRVRDGAFLLESAEQGGIWSRYSFIGVAGFGLLSQVGDRASWTPDGLDERRAFGGPMPEGPLDALQALHSRWQSRPVSGLPPLTGGLVGFVGWEAVRQLERLPDAPPAEHPVPGQALVFVRELVALDHATGTVHLVATVLNDEEAPGPDALWAEAQARLDDLERALAAPAEAVLQHVDLAASREPRARTRPDDFLAVVERAKEHVVAGDVFQVVLSQRFELDTDAHPLDVYRVLRVTNPSPYMYLLGFRAPDGERIAVVGSSPEALVKVTAGRAYSHPIAGSRPRGATPEADIAFEVELLADPKERAEHLMLVDLARNDLLRVCAPGTVDVTEFMRVERFSHIMHIVSSVEGDLLPGRSAVDAFRATFPAGTLSGAPKPRALQLIDALEPAQRGVYGGVVGYFDFAGDADLAIAIRTAVLVGGTAIVQAGAGLVADSDPRTEHEESRAKAAAPLRAIAVAEGLRRPGR